MLNDSPGSQLARGAIDFLSGGGEMGARMRAFGWSATALGPPASWPQSLKTIVRVMLDSRYAMWMLWGPELTFFCNDAYLPTVGLKRNWVLGARSDKVWEEIWPDIGPRIERVLRDGVASWDEGLLLFLERSGYTEETYHTFSYSPVYDDEGRVAGMLCVVTETTDQVIEARRVGMLREIAAQSIRAQGVSTVCKSIVAALDNHPNDVPFAALYEFDATHTSARLLGRTQSALAQVAPEEISLRGDAKSWPLIELLSTGHAQLVTDVRARFGDLPGPWRDPVERALLLAIKGPGQVTPVGCLIVGLSTRRGFDDSYRSFLDLAVGQIAAALADAAAYEVERRRSEALTQIDRAKTAFFSNISHEFRTPLTLILGPVEEIAANVQLPAAIRDQAGLAHRNSLRLLKLVNSLLDFSRIEAGSMTAHYEAIDLAALTAEMAEFFRTAMEHANISYVVECERLTQQAFVDPGQWEKIVMNLLSNAFKFTLHGEVRLRLWGDEQQAVLEVRDTGIGIPAAELPHIFERFHRVEGAQGRTSEGSGIGLALVYELVKLHGGDISVQSALGSGSTFTVRVPLRPAVVPSDHMVGTTPSRTASAYASAVLHEATRSLPDVLPETTAQTAPTVTTPQANRRYESTFGARILLAEDNADMRAHLQSILQPHYQVEVVGDGREALTSLRRAPADLLLTDVMMPLLDGFALLREVREDPVLRDTPIIVLSARAGEEALVESLDAGADDYVVKPFSSRELFARVGALIELVRMRRAWSEREREVAARLEGALADGRVGTGTWLVAEDRLRVDRNFAQLVGIEATNIETESLASFKSRLSAGDAVRLGAALERALHKGADFALDDFRIVHPNGRVVWLTARGKLQRDAQGQPVAVTGVVLDITERKNAESALLASERRVRLAQRAAGTAAWEIDPSTGKAHLSPEAYEFFGIDPEDPDPIATWQARASPEDRRAQPSVAQFLENGGLIEFESRYAHPTRGERWILSHAGLFDDGERRLVAGLSLDITERRRAEAEREHLLSAERAARAEAEAATRTKDEFLATLSHELRTPLSVIVSWSRILQQKFGHTNEQLANGLKLIMKNGLAQSQLISDLLDMSRIVSGKVTLETAPIDLNELVAEVCNSQRPAAEAKGLTLRLQVASQPALVLGDHTRLQQVVWNLLTNAIKFTPSGGRVQVSVAQRDERIEIIVNDTGEGIVPDFIEHVFGRFRQAEGGAARRHGGLGLGLAIVKQLVELHGGNVDAESPGPGKGSTFTVRLPQLLVPSLDKLEATGAWQTPGESLAQNSLAGLTVLAVEDQPDMLEYLRRVLEEHGARVIAATSGAEALDAVRNAWVDGGVDLFVSDLGLPGMDGYELIRHVREVLGLGPADLPAVAVTAFARSEDRKRALAAGFQAHLSKPYQVAQLVSVLNAVCKRDDASSGGTRH